MVTKGLPGWQIISDRVSKHITLSHIGYSIKKTYSYNQLFTCTPQQIMADMHKFCVEAIAEVKKKHIKDSPDCLHSETKLLAELVNDRTIHLILCEKCGSVIFPTYIPGKMVPKAAVGSKSVSIGSLLVSDEFGNELPHSVKGDTVTLKKAPKSETSINIKYKIEDGEMLIQDGDNWLTAEKVEEEPKKKAKKVDAKPGQRKVKFKPS